MDLKQLGEKIKAMRLSRNMTQGELADRINQRSSSIYMYEKGKRKPNIEILEALADVFNVPLSTFLENDLKTVRNDLQMSLDENSNRHSAKSGLTDEDLAKIAQIVSDRHPEISDAPKTEEARILASGIDKLPQADRMRALEFMRLMFVDHADLFTKEDTDT